MCFARPSVSAVDQYCSSNVRRRVCAHARPYQPPKRNSRLEVAQLQNSPRLYHDRHQFNGDFSFRRASAALDYLSRLGITDIYASPLLQSRSGSKHGYDVTDPLRIDSELGNGGQFEAFQSMLQKKGMGLLLDIVPNHMAASPENPWWMDVLENGPASAYAAYFDIDWHPPSLTLDNKILLPVLGSFYGHALNNREFQLVFRRGTFLVQYHDTTFPLTPKTYRRILKHREHVLEKRLGADSAAFQEYLGIVASLAALPER